MVTSFAYSMGKKGVVTKCTIQGKPMEDHHIVMCILKENMTSWPDVGNLVNRVECPCHVILESAATEMDLITIIAIVPVRPH